MKLELGKYYKTKNGTKVGPCKAGDSVVYPYDFPDVAWYYQEDGTCGSGDIGSQRPFDIVSEWIESPVRVVTKRELVPGVYGNLSINGQMGIHVGWTYGAEEIKQLIKTLQEVVEVLEETNA